MAWTGSLSRRVYDSLTLHHPAPRQSGSASRFRRVTASQFNDCACGPIKAAGAQSPETCSYPLRGHSRRFEKHRSNDVIARAAHQPPGKERSFSKTGFRDERATRSRARGSRCRGSDCHAARAVPMVVAAVGTPTLGDLGTPRCTVSSSDDPVLTVPSAPAAAKSLWRNLSSPNHFHVWNGNQPERRDSARHGRNYFRPWKGLQNRMGRSSRTTAESRHKPGQAVNTRARRRTSP